MAAAWLCAVALAAVGLVLLLRLAPEPNVRVHSEVEQLTSRPFGVFIGTSLVKDALPIQQLGRDIFKSANIEDRFVRIATSDLSDDETINQLKDSAEAGVKKIFVQIEPLIVSYSPEPMMHIGLRAVQDFSGRVRRAIRRMLGGRRVAFDRPGFEDPVTDQIYDGNTRDYGVSYPLIVHAPRKPAAVTEALAIVKQHGADVIWVAMPRSETAARFLGSDFEKRFAEELRTFQAAFNAVIWRPAKFWPNNCFSDRAHMNRAGRSRFTAELRSYGAVAE